MATTTNARVGRGTAVHSAVVPNGDKRLTYVVCGSGGLHSNRGAIRLTLDAVTCSKCQRGTL